MMKTFFYSLALAGSVVSAVAEESKATENKQEIRRISVVTSAVSAREFTREVVVQGNVEAKNVALVSPRINGTLMNLFVDEGDEVVAEKSKLLQSDDLNLRNALDVARLDLAVAHCGVKEKQASMDSAEASLESAKASLESAKTNLASAEATLEKTEVDKDRKKSDYERQKRLFEEDKIGTLDNVEEKASEYHQAMATVRQATAGILQTKAGILQAEAMVRQVGASVKHAETLVALSKEQVAQAKAAVRIAEKNLSDATVVAPISGVVSARFQDRGEMGSAGSPVFRIVDLSTLEVSAFLPARYYGNVIPGKTKMKAMVEDVDLGELTVSYRAPTIDNTLRVFEVKCLLKNTSVAVAPGAMVTVSVVLKRENGLGIPKQSITERGGKSVCFVAKGDVAQQVVVKPGMETDGWVQVSGDLQKGEQVITQGQFLLNDGTPINVRSGSMASKEK